MHNQLQARGDERVAVRAAQVRQHRVHPAVGVQGLSGVHVQPSSITLVTAKDRPITSFNIRNKAKWVEPEGLEYVHYITEVARTLWKPTICTS